MTQGDELRRWQAGELARALRQQLQWQQLLGADGAPRSTPEQRRALIQRIRQAKNPAPIVAQPSEQRRVPDRSPVVAQRPAAEDGGQATAATATAPSSPAGDGPALRTEIAAMMTQANPHEIAHDALRAVRDALGDCRRCKLHTGRMNIVFGMGNPAAELVFIGEAPGFHEDKKGEPFVGKAGHLLDKMIVAMGLSRDEVYILNIIKCRPPGNRDPEPDEMAACEPFLVRQLEALRPKIIVTLGRFATQAILREDNGISALRGKWRSYQGVPVMPTFHPAFLLRNPAAKRPCWNDLQTVMKALRGDGS